jgi:tetrahydromethanopterin S-methyltransferase subunit B
VRDLDEQLRIAQLELEDWREKQVNLERQLRKTEEEEKGILAEMARVEEQITYYESLQSDMKKELEPPKLSGMLSSLRKG